MVRTTLECVQMDNLYKTAVKSETRLKFERKWLVLMAAFLSKGLATGFPFNLSVLYVEWLQEFGKSNSETSLIQSVCTGVLLIGGEFHKQICNCCTPLYILKHKKRVKIPRGKSETEGRRRTDNTVTQIKSIKGQTPIDKPYI